MFFRSQAHLLRKIKTSVRFYSPPTVCVKNPATNYVITNIFADKEENVISKAENARNAQSSWQQTPLEERKNLIRNYRDNLSQPETVDELSKTLSSETGKPVSQAAGK